MKAKVKRIDGHRVDDKLKCSFCKGALSRGSFNSKKDRLVCLNTGCGRYGQHQGCVKL